MTTINNVEFNMKSLEIMGTHRNIPNEEIGTDESFITDMGYTGLALRMTGYEKTLAKYDEVINEFMKTGSHTLVHRTGWQFSVYSTQLVPLLGIGIVDNFFPYELTMLTSNPYRQSTTLDCRAKSITANNQEWSAEDMACTILYNWSFEVWSDGVSSAPDGWGLTGTGAAVARESGTIKHGTYSTKITYGSATALLYNSNRSTPSFYTPYVGCTMTFGCWVWCATADIARIKLGDGIETSYSSYHTGSSSWEFLTVSKTIVSNATMLGVDVRVQNTGLAYFDGAILVEGDSIPDSTFIRDIDTDGSVDAVPDIKLIAGAPATSCHRDSLETDTQLDSTIYVDTSASYVLKVTHTFPATDGRGWALKDVRCNIWDTFGNDVYGKVTFTAASYDSGTETTILEDTWNDNSWKTISQVFDDITTEYRGINNEAVTIKFYLRAGNVGEVKIDECQAIMYTKRPNSAINVEVYNIADTTVKSKVCNDIDKDTIVQINTDGAGTIEYSDDFSTDKYLDAYYGKTGITHDTGDDELDIADDGYIYWNCDVKYPVTGVPTLTTQVNITSGTPTIQISSDGSTWYDITTPIVDDVNTVYDLDCSSLHLKGLTEFYWRYDCVKGSPATCSIKSFELDVALVTIDVELPKITATGVSTFRCDQHADSGMNCTVALIYRNRSWPA